MITINYKDFNISYSLNLDDNSLIIKCIKYDQRRDPRNLVDIKYNDKVIKKND